MLRHCLAIHLHRRTRLTTSPARTPRPRPPMPSRLIQRPNRDGVARSVAASCSRALCRVPSPPPVARPTLAAAHRKQLDQNDERHVRSRTQRRSPCALNSACLLPSPFSASRLCLLRLNSRSLVHICPIWPPECTMGLRGSRPAAKSC